MLIFFVILEIFLDAFCFFIIPVFTTFINSEFNLGKCSKASFLFFLSRIAFIFFIAFLYLLFLDRLTSVCLAILLTVLIADLVLAICADGIAREFNWVNRLIFYFWQELQKKVDLLVIKSFIILPLQLSLKHFLCSLSYTLNSF